MIQMIQLPEFRDSRGRLTFAQEVSHLPFEIRTAYLLTDVPDKITLNSPAFIMAPKGFAEINDAKIGGIVAGILVEDTREISVKLAAQTTLLILSSSPISGLFPEALPFGPRRVYFMDNIPQGKSRGNHAHFTTSQLIYAIQGIVDVDLDNGVKKATVHLTGDYQSVEAPLGVWHTLHDFSEDAIIMVLASELFNPDDYISEYSEFLELRKTVIND